MSSQPARPTSAPEGAMVLLFVAMLPLLLGLLVAAPILLASVYTGYRDIYLR